MKPSPLIAAFGICLLLSGTSTQAIQLDQAEILLQHLIRRAYEANHQINRLENEITRHDGQCLEAQIADREGRSHAPYPPEQDPEALSKATESALDRAIQITLDMQAIIDYENQKHTEHPQADVKDLLQHMCGDCKQARAAWAAQVKEDIKDIM